jgi:MFS family permease
VRLFAWVGGRTFASLRNHRNFRLYFVSHAVSFAGTWMQQIAAYWLVLDLTGSPLAVGSLALAQLLPVTLFGLFVGSVIDRFDVRRVLLVTESLLILAAGTLAVLTLTGAVALWHVYVIATFQGLVLVLGNPSRHTLVFRIVGKDDLPNAVALSSALGTMARIAGPGLGGLVVALAGTGVAFAVNSVSYLAVVLALLAMRVSDLHPYIPPAVQTGFRRSIRVMLSFVRRSRRVAVAFFAVLALSTVSFNFDVLLPLLARQTLDSDADVFGLIAAVFGAGALCGALFLATLGKASLRLLLAGACGFGVLELALAPQQSLAAVCVLLFLTGIFYVLWGASALASLQLAAPEHLRGQAASLYIFAFQGGAPLGGLLAGWLTSRGGTSLAFTVAGVSAVIVAVLGAAGLLALQPGAADSDLRTMFRGERREDLGGAGDLGVADHAVGDEPDAARVALQAQDPALGQ